MKTLPSRPNLDHLRRQAKALLAGIAAGDAGAIATVVEHLPAMRGKNAAAVRGAGLRLADAQGAIARQSGFANWPKLARHVEQLRALEGTWAFESLEVDGASVPAGAIGSSRILMDGDRFRSETPGAVYEGVFTIDVEAEPHGIDIEFVQGPESGRWNYGIYRLERDRLEICLDMGGRERPKAFKTAAGSGRAYEVLRRSSGTRPPGVTGGTREAKAVEPAAPVGVPAGFEHVPSATLTRLQGAWAAVKTVKDGTELPAFMLKTGARVMTGNRVTVSFGGSVAVDALVRIDESATPVHIDYANGGGAAKGTVQLGIMEWRGGEAWFCMGAPGGERPREFASAKGSGWTLSGWVKK